MSKKSTNNRGEGNPQAAARFNDAETAFVNSSRGKQAIARGAKDRREDETAVAEAENEGMSRKKPA
jgi:hypothetical protein